MKNLSIASFILLLNITLGHKIGGVFGIFITPIILPVLTLLIFNSKWNSYLKTLIVFLLLSTQDLGTRMFHIGYHDYIGKSITELMFIVGSLLSLILIITNNTTKNKHEPVKHKISSTILFLLLITTYWWSTRDL